MQITGPLNPNASTEERVPAGMGDTAPRNMASVDVWSRCPETHQGYNAGVAQKELDRTASGAYKNHKYEL